MYVKENNALTGFRGLAMEIILPYRQIGKRHRTVLFAKNQANLWQGERDPALWLGVHTNEMAQNN